MYKTIQQVIIDGIKSNYSNNLILKEVERHFPAATTGQHTTPECVSWYRSKIAKALKDNDQKRLRKWNVPMGIQIKSPTERLDKIVPAMTEEELAALDSEYGQ